MSQKTFDYLLSLICSSSQAGGECSNPMTSSEIATCTDRQAELAEKELNAVYRQLTKALADADASFSKEYPGHRQLSSKANLVAAQKAWLAYRNKSCQLEGSLVFSGNPSRGDSEAITIRGCEAQFAVGRSKELRRLAETYGIALP